jgi:hypothetical protein
MSAVIIRFPTERCRRSSEGVLVCEDITPEEIQLMRDAHAMLAEQREPTIEELRAELIAILRDPFGDPR